MKITIDLSVGSIRDAIIRLRQAQDHLRWGLSETINALVTDGAMIANSNYGSMANAIDWMEDETIGKISVVGETPLIAEFGAGDATLEPERFFESVPYTPVYPGSYSELVGTGEYYLTRLETGMGIWHWNGIPFSAVEPKQGLYKAKLHIIESSTDTAKEVIKL